MIPEQNGDEHARHNTANKPSAAAARLAFLIFLTLLSAPAFAQRWHASAPGQALAQPAPPLDDMAHMSWTRRDGAPSDITALAQTADGYLWIGSGLGLYRFDGLRFLSYPFTAGDPQLPSSDIAALAACPDGGLWIGYRMGGITLLRGSKKIDFDQSSGLVSESTEQLVCRNDGSVWATADGRLMHLNGPRWENYSAKHGLASQGLYTLFFDHDGNLWTAEKQHIYELKPGGSQFTEVTVRNKQVNQFAQLQDGAIWVSDAWVHVRPLWDQQALRAIRIPGVPVMLADREDTIWLAHDFGGLTRITSPSTPSQRIENFQAGNGLTDGQTRALLEDKQGAIWVGTARGLDRFQHSPLVRFHAVHLDYFPALIADPNGGIWLNDMDKPLMRFRNGQLRMLDSISHGSSSLFQDSRGGVWLVDPISHEFFRYTDDGNPPLRLPQPDVAKEVETWCIGEDASGTLLASFEGHGLWSYSGKWKPIEAPGLPREAPLSLLKSRHGGVWLGYPHNTVVFEDASGFHVFNSRQGLALNTILAFYEEPDGMLAAGSDGLAYFDGKRFHSLQLRTQNLLRGISGIVKDRRNDLWLNAASGIIHIPEADWKRALKDPRYVMDFQSLNERDGLLGTPAQNKPTPSAVMDKDGILWFATSGHLVSIDPAPIRWGQEGPNVQMQAVLINGSVRDAGENASVSEDGRRLKSLEFDYIGIDLNAADRVTYQYMLEGQDHEWQDAANRGQAFYTNLAPGNYRFRVRATNGTGRSNELRQPLNLAVRPAFYQTTWFFVLCVFSFAASLWIFYRRRVNYLTNQVKQRLEARTHERLRIARDLHDTLLQGIQGLVLRFHYATEQISHDDDAREMLRVALSRADSVINEGREKVRELRSEIASPRELTGLLMHLTESVQAESDAQLQMTHKGEPVPLNPAVQEEVFYIAREALTNAVRHAAATRIDLELIFERRQLRLVCNDDGAGIDADVLRAGFKRGHYGILGMRERAARLGCKLDLRSSPGIGTRIEASIPAKQAYVDSSASNAAHLLARLSLLLHPERNSHETMP